MTCDKCNENNHETFKFCGKCGASLAKQKFPPVYGLMILLIACIVAYAAIDKPEAHPPADPIMPPPPAVADGIRAKGWRFTGDAYSLKVSFTARNENLYSVKDLTIRCSQFGKSGSLISAASKKIFDSIQANGTKLFSEINIGSSDEQANTYSCILIDAERM